MSEGRFARSRLAGRGSKEPSGLSLRALLMAVLLAAIGAVDAVADSEEEALIRAIQLADYESVRALADALPSVNYRDATGGTPLLWATLLGDLRAVEILGAAGADPGYMGSILGSDGYSYASSLVVASCEGHLEVARHLVEALGADVDQIEVMQDEEVGWPPLTAAVTCWNPEIVDYLIKKGADISAKTQVYDGEEPRYPAETAAGAGHLGILRLLVAAGHGIETVDPNGWSLLHHAASAGQTAVVRWLMLQGAELDSVAESGDKPLTLAIAGGHLQTVRFLIGVGAGLAVGEEPLGTGEVVAAATAGGVMLDYVLSIVPDPEVVLDQKGASIVRDAGLWEATGTLELLVKHGFQPESERQELLTIAVEADNDALLTDLLEMLEVDYEQKRGLALRAARNGSDVVFRFLLDLGVDPASRDSAGAPLVQYSVCNGLCAEALQDPDWSDWDWDPTNLELLADRGADLDDLDGSGRTSLGWASALGSDVAVDKLLALGAEAGARDGQGLTPLDHTVRRHLKHGDADRLIEHFKVDQRLHESTVEEWRSALSTEGTQTLNAIEAFSLVGYLGSPLVDELTRLLEAGSLLSPVVKALVEIGDPGVVALVKAAEHRSSLVREHATWALGQVTPSSDVFGALRSRTEDPEPAVQLAAARALERQGGSKSLAILQLIADKSHHEVSTATGFAIERLDPKVILPLAPEETTEALFELLPKSTTGGASKEIGLDDLLNSPCEAQHFPQLSVASLEDLLEGRTVLDGTRIVPNAGRFDALLSGQPAPKQEAVFDAIGALMLVEPTQIAVDAALDGPSMEVRVAAIRALGAMCAADESALVSETLGRLAVDSESRLATASAIAAGRCPKGLPRLVGALEEVVRGKDSSARRAAISSLALVADPGTDLLREALEGGQEEAKRRVSWALSEREVSDDEEVTFEVLEGLLSVLEHSDARVRCHAARALGRWGGSSEWIGWDLVPLLEDQAWIVRAQAALSLRQIRVSDDYSLLALERSLSDPDARVRAASVVALQSHGQSASHLLPAVEEALSDDRRHRVLLAETLSYIGWDSQRASSLLERLLADDSSLVRLAAVRSAPATGPAADAFLPALRGLVRSEDPQLRAAAIAAAGMIEPADAQLFPLAMQLLGDSSEVVRSAATQVLAGKRTWTDEETVHLLKGAAARPNVRAAAEALLRAHGTVIGPAVDRWLDAREIKPSESWVADLVGEYTGVIHAVDAVGNPVEIEYDDSSGAVLLATWCHYSAEFLGYLSDPRVQQFLRPLELTFFYFDESSKVQGFIDDGVIDGDGGRQLLEKMQTSSLPVGLAFPERLESVQGDVVFVIDEEEVPKSFVFPYSFAHFFPTVYVSGGPRNGSSWLGDQLPDWLAEDLGI